MNVRPMKLPRPLLRLALGAVALAASCGPAMAQTAPDRLGDLERKLEASLKLIEQLNGRLQRMEAAGGARPASPEPAAPELAAKLSDLEQQIRAVSSRPEEDRGLAMHGFADVGWARSSLGRPSGGSVGALDFYMTPKFGDRVISLVELNFEVSDEGAVGVDLERLQVGYIVNDQLTLWAGRFHTPYGYWNTAFHHGAQLQTSVLRPRFLDFEDRGGILPAHSVGLWGTGGVKFDAGRLNYDVYLANSSRIGMADPATPGTGVLDMRQAGATDRGTMVGTNVNFGFKGSLDGLSIGVHTLRGAVGDTLETGPHRTRLNMAGAWAGYNENNWELSGELYRFNNQDLSDHTGSHASQAWYAQAGYSMGLLTAYARMERTALDQSDNYFAQQASGQSYKRNALGLRYEINPKTSLKLEANRTSMTDRTPGGYSELRSQLAVRF